MYDTSLWLGGKEFKSRLIVGTGKYPSFENMREAIEASGAELVLIGTPIDLRRLIELDKPALRVTYKLQEIGEPTLKDLLGEKGLLETALV